MPFGIPFFTHLSSRPRISNFTCFSFIFIRRIMTPPTDSLSILTQFDHKKNKIARNSSVFVSLNVLWLIRNSNCKASTYFSCFYNNRSFSMCFLSARGTTIHFPHMLSAESHSITSAHSQNALTHLQAELGARTTLGERIAHTASKIIDNTRSTIALHPFKLLTHLLC